MRNIREREYLTTGDIAKMLDVNFRTVIRWIQREQLKAFQLPGTRGDNRIHVHDLMSFLRTNHIPIPKELQHLSRRVLLVEPDPKSATARRKALENADFEVEVATSWFEAGRLTAKLSPHIVVVDLDMEGMSGLAASSIFSLFRAGQAGIKIMVMTSEPDDDLDADAVLKKPCRTQQIVALCKEFVDG